MGLTREQVQAAQARLREVEVPRLDWLPDGRPGPFTRAWVAGRVGEALVRARLEA